MKSAEGRANLVPDAHVAALAIEHGLVLCSTDGDFARFDVLEWVNPLNWTLGSASRNHRLDPSYQPILSPETVAGRLILVVWAPASEVKPHRAPDAGAGPGRYWIRLGSETVDAERRGDLLTGLVQQTARVPWDDRRALDAEVGDLREAKVREYLRDVGSGLLDEPDERRVYRRMRLTTKVNDHEAPRKAGLLFFARSPVEWFRGRMSSPPGGWQCPNGR